MTHEEPLVISSLTPSTLSPRMLSELKQMTEERFFCCFEGLHPEGISETKSLILAAKKGEQIVGLAIASMIPLLRLAHLHSFYVLHTFRKEKIASSLLQTLQEELYKHHCQLISFTYRSDLPSLPILEHLLQKNGWSPPKNFQLHCTFTTATFNPPWLKTSPSLPPEITEFSWQNLSSQEEARLLYLATQQAFPPDVSPFKQHKGPIEPLNSLGLKYRDQIIGWMVTHRIAPDTIDYSSLFIYPEYQSSSIAIRLLKDAIDKQLKSDIPFGVFDLNLQHVDATWFNFVKKRLIPYATQVTYSKQTWHFSKKDCNRQNIGI